MANQYPGNPNLPSDVRQRVISTFRQTVDLTRKGNTDQAAAGVDFILRMDPQFEPARRLALYWTDPSAGTDLDALLEEVATDGGDALAEAQSALDARDFSRALEIASDALRNDMSNAEAQRIAEEAQGKLEAAPFVEQFVKTATDKLRSGNSAGAIADLEKARQLDAAHPRVLQLQQEFGQPQPVATTGFDFGSAASPFDGVFGGAPPAPSSDFGAISPSSSFVVEETPGAASGTPASDFGFTFEEEREAPAPGFGGVVASGTPQEELGGAHTFDFATASVETTTEDRENIRKYLEDGDKAYEAGEYQSAIDIWSRVFLIDVTNDDASERIDRARKKRQEIDKRVEELIVAGTLAFEKNDHGTARAKFEEALALDPNNYNAKEYLGRIGEGATAPAAAPAGAVPRPSVERDIFDAEFDDEEATGGAVLVPPDPAAVAAQKRAAPAPTVAAQKKTAVPMLPLIAVVALLVLGVGGYFAYKSFFGNAQKYDPAETRQIFTKAERLSTAGQFDQAIALLLTIQPQDPEHDRALEMIDDLKDRKAASSGLIDGRPAAVVFQETVDKGRSAFEAKDYLAAKQAFEHAASIQPLPSDAKMMYDAASQQVAKLNDAILLMKENKYADAVANLQSLQQQDPENGSVRQLLLAARYNNGVVAMQQERLTDAMAEFDEVLKANPNDTEAKRSRELAAKYNGQAKDLMFKIYVKYLPLRSF